METKTLRKQKSIKLKPQLVEILEIEAKRQNRSFNNLVELILERAINSKPNNKGEISPKFAKKIDAAHQDFLKGETITVNPENIWESIT